MPHLAIFSSTNHGFNRWNQIGSLSRELAIFKRFVAAGWTVSFFTYDRTRRLPGVGFDASVHPQWPFVMPRQLNFLYHSFMPFRFLREGQKVDILITLQAHSSGPAILASRLWKAKLVARCGYVFGQAAEILGMTGRPARKIITKEKATFRSAQICLVPTRELKTWVCRNYQLPDGKVAILPNYVDTNLFAPMDVADPEFDVIVIGRLVPYKRHELLLDAFAGTTTKIHMIGNGVMRNTLRHLAKEKQNNVQFTPRVVHDLLPHHLNQAKIYVTLSTWEGHPKSLIEAMACARACVAARSPGMENVLIHGESGLLVDPEPGQLRDAVERLLADSELRNRLGKNAREYALQHYSLDIIFPRYKRLLEQLLEA